MFKNGGIKVNMIYIYELDALEKMAKVEGEEWLSQQRNFGNYSFQAFKDVWERDFKPIQNEIKNQEQYYGIYTDDGDGAIYGAGGWNRYTVREDGEIMFIRYQARNAESLKKAEEVGFRIF